MGRKRVARYLSKLYYNPSLPPALGGIRRINSHLKKIKKNIIARNVTEWLRGEDPYTLHKMARKNFPRRKTIVYGENNQLQADLADMQQHHRENEGFRFLLTLVDVFSKKGYVIPLKSKSGKEVSRAFEEFFEKSPPIKAIQTDKGREFYNGSVAEVFKKFGVKHFSSHDERTKAAVVERWNRTLKQKLYRWFTKTGEYRYIDILQDIVGSYNETPHRATGIPPNEVDATNREDVWNKLYPPVLPRKNKNILKIGDYVRISRAVENFGRGYTPNWSYEIFVISEVLRTAPVCYKIKDLQDEDIEGSFYGEELQLVKKSKSFKIERIIKSRGKGKNKQYYVKFKGYPDKFNDWVNEVRDIN